MTLSPLFDSEMQTLTEATDSDHELVDTLSLADLHNISDVYQELKDKLISVANNTDCKELVMCLINCKALLHEKLPATKPWFKMSTKITTLKFFILAEQTGN